MKTKSSFTSYKLLCLLVLLSLGSKAQIITTAVGGALATSSGDSLPALSTSLQYPEGGMAFDAAGNLYFCDYGQSRVRKYNLSTGLVTIVAGNGTAGFSGDGGAATSAALSDPMAVTVDKSGNVYIADYGNYRIRRVDASTGTITTIAGTGTYGYNGDHILATSADLYEPSGIALDTAGNLYFSHFGDMRVRRIDKLTGIITTAVGTGTAGYNGDGIADSTAQLNMPHGICFDQNNNLYIADNANYRIRKVSGATGLISTVAGNGIYGNGGDGASAILASLKDPWDVDVDASGNILIADRFDNKIRKVSGGIINIVAGTGTAGYSGDGGLATSAMLSACSGVVVNSCGQFYINDDGNSVVRKVGSFSFTANSANVSCFAACDGTIGLHASGGTAPYTYSWTPGTTTGTVLTNACAGNYFVSSTDATGCQEQLSITLTQPPSMQFTATTQSNVTCNSNGVGLASINGSANYPVTYTWSAGTTTGSINNSLPPGIQTVTVTDASGCSATASLNVLFTPTLAVTLSVTPGLCMIPGSVTANPAGTTPYTYSWSVPGGTNTLSSLSAGNYSLSVTDGNGCIVSQTFAVVVLTPTFGITVNVIEAACSGPGSATASPGGLAPYTYSWSVPGSSNTVGALSPGSYSVSVTDGAGCVSGQSFTIGINTPTFASVPICFVTVDSLSMYNVITWNKLAFPSADSFIVYRETGTNVYQPIQAQPYSAFSQFADTVRALYFPNTGDPNVGTYRYKLRTKDSCGNYSEYSPYHNTLFLVSSGGTFSWSQLYQIEGATNPVLSYVLERDDLSNGNWQAVGSVAGTQQFIIDPAYSSFQTTASWRVRTQWNISCTPARSANFTNSSYSNRLANANANVGLQALSLDQLLGIYPNPSKGYVSITQKTPAAGSLEIISLTGEKIYSGQTEAFGTIQLDLSSYAAGMYLVKYRTATQSVTGKLIIED